MILCKCFEILRKKYWEANLGVRAAYECLAAVNLRMTNRLSFNIHFTLSSSLSNIFRWENRFHIKTVFKQKFWTKKIQKIFFPPKTTGMTNMGGPVDCYISTLIDYVIDWHDQHCSTYCFVDWSSKQLAVDDMKTHAQWD